MQIKTYLIACLIFLSINNVHSQVEFGFRMGLSSTNLAVGEVLFNNDESDIKLDDVKFGHHFGFYSRIELLTFYIEPAMVFNSSRVNYSITNYSESPLSTFSEESYLDLNIPLLVGMKMGFIRVAGGPVAHVSLNSGSELFNFDQYGEKTKQTSYGYQLGAGLDLWAFRLDMNYEGNFSNKGEKTELFGTEFTNNTNSSRWVASLGIKF